MIIISILQIVNEMRDQSLTIKSSVAICGAPWHVNSIQQSKESSGIHGNVPFSSFPMRNFQRKNAISIRILIDMKIGRCRITSF